MKTLADQLAHEEKMAAAGVTRYLRMQDAARDSRATQTSAGSNLLRHYILSTEENITLFLDGKHPEGRRRNAASRLLDGLDPAKIAYLGLKCVIQSIFAEKDETIQSVCINIGRACEDELRFSKFETEHKEYYDALLRDFERKNTRSYQHKRRVLRGRSMEKGMLWEEWTTMDAFKVGAVVLSLVLEVADIAEKKSLKMGSGRKATLCLAPTQECIDWISAHDEAMSLTLPDRMPCIVPPAPWVNWREGGFYSASLRRRTPLIKTRDMTRQRRELYDNASMPDVLRAVNTIQNTAWAVNKRVLETMREVRRRGLGCGMPSMEPTPVPPCPLGPEDVAAEMDKDSPLFQEFLGWKAYVRNLHTAERERFSKNLAVTRVMQMASEMSEYDAFWYVYQCDFRGRIYCTTAGLTPQGTDISKGLIQFASGKKLRDKAGLDWFLINGANKFGYDKASYKGRVEWALENADKWRAVAMDPISHRKVWADADKPFQFLAWCFEFFDADQMENPFEFVSHLPVGMDGSCNGLQHFSAMLRDEVGGRAVNLIQSDKPADIYQTVADVCTEKLKVKDDPHSVQWMRVFGEKGMPRKLSKKPVMTLPYGSTERACTDSIYGWIMENAKDDFDSSSVFVHAIHLTPELWGSIGEVVIAARAAMDWIQDCAGIVTRAGHPIMYFSPLGFPVYQSKYVQETKQVETQIGGRLRLRIGHSTDKLDGLRQRNGASPNLVHHADATHLMMAVNAAEEAGIEDFAMIHDDFGCHACDAEDFNQIIRKTFVEMHTDFDILGDFKQTQEALTGCELPDVPPSGDLDLTEVLKSPYFFG